MSTIVLAELAVCTFNALQLSRALYPLSWRGSGYVPAGYRGCDSSGHYRNVTLRCPLARIIPAHAGQTCWSVWTIRRFTDHPRACGANRHTIQQQPAIIGSSPRMRGKQLDCRARIVPNRIIPAHAGQTQVVCIRFISVPDHPRACGANSNLNRARTSSAGSSPRMRGKHNSATRCCPSARIIPAHAGQTELHARPTIVTPDHPRACGANVADWWRWPQLVGSSPRMRGKQ